MKQETIAMEQTGMFHSKRTIQKDYHCFIRYSIHRRYMWQNIVLICHRDPIASQERFVIGPRLKSS